MKADILKRVEALERDAALRSVLWIGPPEAGLEGWQVVSMTTGTTVEVWRLPDESNHTLEARAAMEANKLRGVVVVFGMDREGLTR